jgi:hypothetical protein
MPLTSEQRIHQDDRDSHGDAGVREIEDGEAAHLKKVEDVAKLESVDEVADGSSEDEGEARLEEGSPNPHEEEDEDECHRNERGDAEEEAAASGEDSERAADIVRPRQAKYVSQEAAGFAEHESVRRPRLEESIQDHEESGEEEIGEAAHGATGYLSARPPSSGRALGYDEAQRRQR